MDGSDREARADARVAPDAKVPRLERRIPVDYFTEPGDPFKLDYSYQNGVQGFLHAGRSAVIRSRPWGAFARE
jgi:hypothetical protein